MNRTWHQINAFKTTDHSPPNGVLALENKGFFIGGRILAVLLSTVFLLPIASHAQSLDEAVSSQLDFNPATGLVCSQLRNGNPAAPDFLSGQLNAICSRGNPSGGAGPSTSSTGGGAAIPATLPAIVQKRLREARVKEEKPKLKPPTARAAAVAKIGGRLNFFYSGEHKSFDQSLTSFEDGQNYKILSATHSTDYRFTNRVLQRSEEKILNNSQGFYTGSFTVLAAKTDQVNSLEPHQVTEEGPALASKESPKPNGLEQIFRPSVGLWGVGEYENLDRDTTPFEDGYDSDIWRVTVGADYQFTDRIMTGLAFDHYRHDGEYDGGGGFNNDSFGILVFGVFRPSDQTFLQVTAGYARKQYDRDRVATYTETNSDDSPNFKSLPGSQDGDYNADQFFLNAITAYNYFIGNVTLSPRIGVDYCYVDFDTYSETGRTGLELTFYDDVQKWLQSRVGAQASMAWSTGFGLIVPHASVDWVHEFENDQRDVEVSFVDDTRGQRFSYNTEKPDRDFFEFNAGIAMALPHGFQILGNYRTLVGHSFFEGSAGSIRIRYAF